MKFQPPLRPDEWKKLFELRDDLDDEDRSLLRKFIKRNEYLDYMFNIIGRLLSQEETK